ISQNPSQKYLNKISEVQTHHLKLLQYDASSTNSPPLASSNSASLNISPAASQSLRPMETLSNPVHTSVIQPTTVIIRKDFHSFNFSDIELPVERPTASVHYLRNKHLMHDLSQRSVTGTPKPPTTELDDIFISVKTTKSYHDSRLAMIVKTWFQLAKDQTWFFTDTDDAFYQEKTSEY
uniref:Fringe-like glycosyltransferase domain-containing protein n=1 Tax=Stomoxys calcitrans TaxID=35570 RepID=A0A1I8PYC3_STOCA